MSDKFRMMGNQVFLSDLTSSEGTLSRYSDICKSMSTKGYTSSQIHNLIEIDSGLTNEKVRNRHLNIMKIMRLVNHKVINGIHIYSLDSAGKILKYIKHSERDYKRQLFIEEQIVFSYNIFNNIKIQITSLLESIDNINEKDRNLVMVEYFNNIEKNRMWDNLKISNGIRLWNNEKIINRSFRNIFKCLEMWLIDLSLLKKDEYALTKKGKMLITMMKNMNHTFDDVVNLYLNENLNVLNVEKSDNYNLVKKEVMYHYNIIKELSGFADIPVLFSLIIMKIAIDQLKILPYDSQNHLLNKLWKDGIVTSLSNDDKGQLRYIVLQT